VRRLFAPALVAATLWVYAPVRDYGFLNHDDSLFVTERPEVRQGLTAAGVAWAFTNLEAGNWLPLAWLSHMLDVELFGLDAGAHHLVNVALHALSALLCFALLSRATGRPGPAAFAAAVFALHPLRVESVAWIAERRDVLAGVCFFSALGLYGRYCAAPSAGRAAALFVAAALGLLAKAMLMTLPLCLLLLDVWPLRRLAGRADWPARLREKWPLALLCAAVAGVALYAQARGGAVTALDVLPPGERIANALVAAVAYLRDTLWPAQLAALYPHPRGGLPLWQPLGAAALLGALTLWAWRVRHARPCYLVGWLWFLVMLLPVIGLVQVGAQARADRYTYLPLLGPVVAVSFGIADACAGRAVARALPALACAVLLGLALSSRATLAYWESDEALFARAAAVTRDNAVAYSNWANALDARPEEQRALLLRALAADPSLASAHYLMGRSLARTGDLAGAERHYRLALRGDPDDARARNNLGNLLFESGRTEEAIAEYRQALAAEPGRPRTPHNLSVALRARAEELSREGRGAEAEAALREAASHARAPAGSAP
jgi:tetratricopeptide (TPR) repeat protein